MEAVDTEVVAADTEAAVVNTKGFVRLPSQPSKISNPNSSPNFTSEMFELLYLLDDCDIGIGFLPAQKSVMQLFSQGPAGGFSLVTYIFICLTLRSLSERRLQSSDLLVTLLKNEPSTAHVVSVIVDFVLLLKCT